MPSIADDPTAELRKLRERAYGPAADIHDDPYALGRLRELESRARGTGTAAADPTPARDAAGASPEASGPVGPSSAPTPADPVGVQDSGAIPDAPSQGPADAVHSPTPDPRPAAPLDDPREGASRGADADLLEADEPGFAPARRWTRRAVVLTWLASLIVAGLIGAGITVALQESAIGSLATLQADQDAGWPDFMGDPPDGGTRFEDFRGVVVLLLAQDGTQRTVCLYLLDPRPENGNFLGGGCGVPGLPLTASLVVGSDSPEELREAFDDGTALQFDLRGSEIRVYAVPPATPGTGI